MEWKLLITFLVVLAIQHSVIWLVSKDRRGLEKHTSYRITPRGEVITPDFEI